MTPLSPCSLGLHHHKVQTSLKILLAQLKVLPAEVFEAFEEKLIGAVYEPAKPFELIMLSIDIQLQNKNKPPKPNKWIHSVPLFFVSIFLFPLCSLHNALRDNEDVSNPENDKRERGDVDSEKATNLQGETIDNKKFIFVKMKLTL